MQAIIWLVLGAVLILASSSEAACTGSSPTWSSTPDYASVSTCVSNASSGNTINVSAGSATWLSRLSVTKNVSIVGAGIGNTVIISGLGGTLITFVMPASTTTLTRLSGMTFILNNHHGIACYNVSQSPPVHLFRVDHMRFQDSTAAGSAIETFGCRGVIDTSEFDNLQYPLRIGWGDPGGGGFDWNNYPELVWGKPDDNMYVEDCVFTNISTAITDSDEGGAMPFGTTPLGGRVSSIIHG